MLGRCPTTKRRSALPGVHVSSEQSILSFDNVRTCDDLYGLDSEWVGIDLADGEHLTLGCVKALQPEHSMNGDVAHGNK